MFNKIQHNIQTIFSSIKTLLICRIVTTTFYEKRETTSSKFIHFGCIWIVQVLVFSRFVGKST